ncbi:MAG: cupredoxin domain-containing protein [Candidatus Nitrosotenuis sp.]
MSNWDLMMPGMGLTAIGVAGVTISFAGIAHTFIDGMHALTGLTMFVGLIFLAAGILDGGISTSNRAKATTLVVLGIVLSFAVAGLTFNAVTSIPTFAGVMLIVTVPTIVIAYVAMKMPEYAKPVGVIFILATGAAIAAYVGFGLYGPSQYLVPPPEEVEEEKIAAPSAPITAISILKGSSVNGAPDYEPDVAQVPTGNNIEWTNNDEVAHTVTSAADAGNTFDSSLINAGGKYLLDTSKLQPGTYEYMCIVHPWMIASFDLGDASGQRLAEGATATDPNSVPPEAVIEEVPAEEISEVPAEDVVEETTSVEETIPAEEEMSAPSELVIVEMAAGTASNQDCADQCFIPSTAHVTVGGTITWKNVDSAAHTATEMNSKFDSSIVMTDGEFSHTFEEAGTFDYMCIVHPWMKGQVVVG